MPKVSVVIPTYNHAQYIGDAIQSVLNQDYNSFEIIMINDGSTDNTREVVAQFGDQVRCIWQENQGLSAARNTGIRVASGDLIGLLDADDIYEPYFLSTLVTMLQANPDADGIYCGYRFVDDQNTPLAQVEARSIPPDQLYQALISGNFLVPESMLARRHCYEAVGPFDESLRACEDWDIWLKMARQFKIIGTNKVLTRHRVLSGSMSSDPARMLSNRLAVIQKHFGQEPEDPTVWSPTQRQAYGRAYLTSAIEYMQYHDAAQAYVCLRKMAAINSDLLTELEPFYELGCGDQPKGSRGDFATLDVTRNAEVVIHMLDSLFDDTQAGIDLRGQRRAAYANAYFALGLLSYGARQFRQARGFLLRAATIAPNLGLQSRFVTTLLKSLPGAPLLVDQLKARYRTKGLAGN